jgi:hypothetical protein
MRDAGKAGQEVKDVERGNGIGIRQGCWDGVGTDEPAVNLNEGTEETIREKFTPVGLLKVDAIG